MPQMEIGPSSKKQEWFVNSECDITVFGGSAGSGKTHCMLLTFLRFVNDPHTTGVIFRRTTKQLTTPGGIWDNAVTLYKQIDPKMKIRQKDHSIEFSSGAILQFSHLELERNKYDHQGGQYSFVGFDEGTHFTEGMITYLASRMRNVNVKYKPQMFITCNPDYDSFLRKWIEWYLDSRTGIPDPKKAGKVRWFCRPDGNMLWGRSKNYFREVLGQGKEVEPQSFCFIPATCRDNPILLANDPGYVGRLKNLPRVEMERLLLGSWYARESTSGYWKKDWVQYVSRRSQKVKKRVRAWDLAGSLPSEAMPDPDWTAGVLMSRDIQDRYTVEDVIRFRDRAHVVETTIFETAEADGRDVEIIIPCDPGAAGKAYAADLVRRLAEAGYTARMKTTNKGKVTRFTPFAAVSEAGFVQLIDSTWTSAYIDELEAFDGTRNIKDDQVDATADAFWALKSAITIPNFKLPDFSKSNDFALNY